MKERKIDNTILGALSKDTLWTNKVKQDCIDERVFLAIRKGTIAFYHKGGRLFYFQKEFATHPKYAAVIEKNSKNYLTESQLVKHKLPSDFSTDYARIKENCSKYAGVEASGVAEIFHRHSYLSDSNVVVLDIEVSFESLSDVNKVDRIDILLYNKNKQALQFIEAKHYSNGEIWSTGRPDVLDQLDRYENQVRHNKDEIIEQYKEYINTLNTIFGISPALPEPLYVDDRVTLLLFGFDGDQLRGRLKSLITSNTQYSGVKFYPIGGVAGIDPEVLWEAKDL